MFVFKSAIVFLLGMQVAFAEAPAWFHLPSERSYEIMGYGQADTLDEARGMALKEISQTLKVNVSSSTDINNKLKNDEYNQEITQNLKTSTSAVLIGSKVDRSVKVDEVWYVAVVYDTSSYGAKLKRALNNSVLKNEKLNYLSSTSLVRGINEEVGYKLRYKLLRENDLWKLQYRDIKLVISESDIVKLFAFNNGSRIGLKLNKKIFYPQDVMQFSIGLKKPGYVSMLYVEANGKVGVLFANKKQSRSSTYPAKNSDEELVVANPYKKVLNEMYLTTLSQKPLNLTLFESVQSSYLDESNYKFAELVTLLDKTDFSSVVVKIKF